MAKEKIAVLGSGGVSDVLANGFLKFGYEVMRGSRSPEKLQKWKSTASKKASIGTFEEAAQFGDIVVLAVKGSSAESAIQLCGGSTLNGKIIIDVTNPIADRPPVNGVLQFFTEMNHSSMEKLQQLQPNAKFVKSFSCVGKDHMVKPKFGECKPSMFICGNDDQAKLRVSQILQQFGWDSEDMGPVEAARAIEPLCMLWCIPGMRNNEWNHAFKLLKKGTQMATKKKTAAKKAPAKKKAVAKKKGKK